MAAPPDIRSGGDVAVAFRPGEYRPQPSLLKLYAVTSLALGPLFFLLLVPRLFRYHSLRYAFDEEGVSMRWGVLFRKEVSLTYARIQDIHLVSNVIERWLGLGRVQVQTASGSAGAEMTIEGLPQFEAVRDFLYTRMRGAHGESDAVADAGLVGADERRGSGDAVVDALHETAAALRALRETLAARAGAREP